MFSSFSKGSLLLILIALIIVVSTLFLSNMLAKKIAADETRKIELWAQALSEAADPSAIQTNLATKVLTENNRDIPIILTNENDSVIDHYNIDTASIIRNQNFLAKKIMAFNSLHSPIVWVNPANSSERTKIYYGESSLLKQIRLFPIAQLFVVTLFILLTLYAMHTRNKSTQNQLWAGMAKEAAHQLGTPITSLEGWVENLKLLEPTQKLAGEIQKDVERLKLVSERFGKIGSAPQMEMTNLVLRIQNMVEYIRRRAPESIEFKVHTGGKENISAIINPPLFDWVIENLLKNSLDAMNNKGTIHIYVTEQSENIIIDVTDTGKGMSKFQSANAFKPGFTTKKRGWGLGLTLTKRIVEEYHKGEILIKQSEQGRGTTFRVILKKAANT